MFKKATIFFSLLFLAGCSVSNQLVINKQNVGSENKQSNINDYGEIIDIDLTEINPRELISNYLLSQKDFAWQTEQGGQNFCAFYPFNPINEIEVYIWVRCSELGLEEEALQELSGISLPVKLTYLEENKLSHTVPRDGALYNDDLENIFPKEIRDMMIKDREIILVNTHSDLLEEAKRYFGIENFLEIPNSFIQYCKKDSDCITPFNYMIRSSCPYSSKCVDEKCEITCEY